MKTNRIGGLLAAVLSAGILAAAMPVSASEAGAYDDVTLPSGMTVGMLREAIDSRAIPKKDTISVREYASAGLRVFQGDTVLFSEYYGYINEAESLAADDDTVYEWGSITKTFIWVSAMQLWEQGRLDLDRDVREYLPDGFFQHLKYDDPITMLHLMNHNAGWQESTALMIAKTEAEVPSLKEALQALEPIQTARPGEIAAYSNYGAAVAGYVIECITGMPFSDYVRQNILDPLGMEHTAVTPAHTDNAWVHAQREKAHSYQFRKILMNDYLIDLGQTLDYITCYPAGAATGTLGDLTIYAQALVSDDAPLFQSKETQEKLLSGTAFYGDSDIPICCHGFWCSEQGVRVYGHNGATPFGQADMEFDPVTKFGYVTACNEYDGNWIFGGAGEWVFGSMAPDTYGAPQSDAEKPDGYYRIARGYSRGMMQWVDLIKETELKFGDDMKAENLGKNVVQFSDGNAAILVGTHTAADGRQVLQTPSADLFRDRFYVLRLVLFTLYATAAAAAYYLLRIRLRLKLAGKWRGYGGAAVIGAGYGAQLLSLLSVLVLGTVFLLNFGGASAALFNTVGTVQMLCGAVCAAAAVRAGMGLFSAKCEKAVRIWYGISAAGNLLTVLAIILFEMFRFWA